MLIREKEFWFPTSEVHQMQHDVNFKLDENKDVKTKIILLWAGTVT